MRPKELIKLGVGRGQTLELAIEAASVLAKEGHKKGSLRKLFGAVVADPKAHFKHPQLGSLARAIVAAREASTGFVPRKEPAPWRQWGTDIEPGAVKQMVNACNLPVSIAGALMPDAHLGYGLPIGGVLAVRDAVIPYAVGMDIACRMKLSVLDWPVSALETKQKQLKRSLEQETSFGVGASFKNRRQHEVMDENWSISKLLKTQKDRAWRQLGTSGSGNHFVEFGVLTLEQDELGLKKGRYLSLLSHSGSRGVGGEIAKHYSKLAMNLRPELPKELKHLAWLDLDSAEGSEYWLSMELMGRYASANHFLIHHHVINNLGAQALVQIENHHNFAWKEEHQGKKLIIHRKGATPAHKNTMGIIPGSMATPGYVIKGLGNTESINSSSHGAGRKMSRKAAKEKFDWHWAKKFLEKNNVTLLSAGLDEVPMAYKDIEEVMSAQADLVKKIARFDPRLVMMAQEGERPED